MPKTIFQSFFVVVSLFGAVVFVPGVLAAEGQGPIDIGREKQLLFDDYLLEKHRNVEFVMNPPVQSGELLLRADQPHEAGGHINLYCSVLEEPEGRIRVWYDLIIPTGPGPYDHHRRVCYAESRDGIRFEKPKLGMVDIGGSRDNNVVIPGVIGGSSVWIDPKAPPSQKYKTQAKVYPSGKFVMHSSPDGLNWSQFAQIDPRGPHDTQTVIFWDAPSDRYLFFGRHKAITPEIDILCRSVRRAELKELTAIENTGLAIWPDAIDRAKHVAPANETPVDYYGATVFPYPDVQGVYVMLAQAFWHWLPTESRAGTSSPGMRDVRLAISRDSKRFERVGGRRPFLRPGPSGRFDSKQIWAMPNPVFRGDEIWIYYSGLNWDRTDATDQDAPSGKRVSGVGRAVLRRDGFVSLDAPYDGGEFTTRPLIFRGSRLELNVDTSAGGGVLVELLDKNSRPLPGFSGGDAIWIVGNSVRMPVRWKNGSDLQSLAGKPIRLHVQLRDSKLYAFQFP